MSIRRCGALALAALAWFAASAAHAQTPAPSYAGYFQQLPCVDRIGRCFDATVGGQPVEAIGTKAEFDRLGAEIKAQNPGVREVYWQVRQPLSGQAVMDVAVKANALGRANIGEPRGEPQVMLYAIDRQRLEATREVVANQNVRVNGQATLSQQNTLAQDSLPPGRYVFEIRYPGSRNWDRKTVLLTVR
jgi:hypothetical protein